MDIKWGESISNGPLGSDQTTDIFAMLDFDSPGVSGTSPVLDKRIVHKIIDSISKVVGGAKIVPLRCSGFQVLVKFQSHEDYELLGKRFLDQNLPDLSGFKLMEVQGMVTEKLFTTRFLIRF